MIGAVSAQTGAKNVREMAQGVQSRESHFSIRFVVGLSGMWESRSDFQGLWKAGCAFHQYVISTGKVFIRPPRPGTPQNATLIIIKVRL
ncbi:MAG TPA: hypothetical protein VH437_18220 [Terriglobales bacterium]|jgi:hypothetical protein